LSWSYQSILDNASRMLLSASRGVMKIYLNATSNQQHANTQTRNQQHATSNTQTSQNPPLKPKSNCQLSLQKKSSRLAHVYT